MSDIKAEKAIQQRNQQLHALKNTKILAGSLNFPSAACVSCISHHCQQALPTPEAVLALTSLLTGWSIAQLLHCDTRTFRDKAGDVSLISTWEHSDQTLSPELKKLMYRPMDNGLIPLPQPLGQLLHALIADTTSNINEADVKHFLSEIHTPQRTSVTANTLVRVLSHYATSFDLTALEYRFISGARLRDSSQNSYIQFDTGDAAQKLQRYWDFVLGKGAMQYPMPLGQQIGSKRVLRPGSVKRVFDEHKTQMEQAHHIADMHRFFNAYTLYLIDLLQFFTLSRPQGIIFGGLNNFDSRLTSIFIEDKGEGSARILPLPKKVGAVLKHFLDYLRYMMQHTQYSDRQSSTLLNEIFAPSSSVPIFHLYDKKRLKPATTSNLENLFRQYGPVLHRNWHRHTVLSALYAQGLSCDALAVFADHQPPRDHWFNPLSSTSYQACHEVSQRIEQLFHTWQLPLLTPNWE